MNHPTLNRVINLISDVLVACSPALLAANRKLFSKNKKVLKIFA
jgi:hypothetical protein